MLEKHRQIIGLFSSEKRQFATCQMAFHHLPCWVEVGWGGPDPTGPQHLGARSVGVAGEAWAPRHPTGACLSPTRWVSSVSPPGLWSSGPLTWGLSFSLCAL